MLSIQGLAITSSDANARNHRASPSQDPNRRANPSRGASPNPGLSTTRYRPAKKRRLSPMKARIG
jgi:hypothetical protein